MSFKVLNPASVPAQLTTAADSQTLKYCQALSKALLSSEQVRQYPDLVALGFWLRAANIKNLLSYFEGSIIRPVGHVFHAAPGNVDSLFVYSGILSLLCGNLNTIRLSSKLAPSKQEPSKQAQQNEGSAQVFCRIVQQLAEQFPEVNARFQIVQSEHHAADLLALVSKVDARVLWGSDAGIQSLRSMPMPAHAKELTFANKLSFAVIDLKAYQEADQANRLDIAEKFARDNLTYAQQACSSAKLLFWLIGSMDAQQDQDTIKQTKQAFWHNLEMYLASEVGQTKYGLNSSEQYKALNNAQSYAIQKIANHIQTTPYFTYATLAQVSPNSMKQLIGTHTGCGLFLETELTSLQDLNGQLTPLHQSLTYWGIPKGTLKAWLPDCLVGIDRVVPIGEALNFSPVWDGVHLLSFFSRQAVFSA